MSREFCSREIVWGGREISFLLLVVNGADGYPVGTLGDCYITVEAAGPAVYNTAPGRAGSSSSTQPLQMRVAPTAIRGMAGAIIQECIGNQGNIGGFITLGVVNLGAFELDTSIADGAPFRESPVKNFRTLVFREYPAFYYYLALKLEDNVIFVGSALIVSSLVILGGK